MSKANDFRLHAEEAIRCSPIRNQTSERGADRSCAHMDASCVLSRAHQGAGARNGTLFGGLVIFRNLVSPR
jgi:hypothetical protein